VQLGIQSAFGSPDTTGTIPFWRKLAVLRGAFRCVAWIMMRSGLGPAPETVIERFVGAVSFWCVLPLQAVLDDVHDATDDTPIIGGWNPVRWGKCGSIRAAWRSFNRDKSPITVSFQKP